MTSIHLDRVTVRFPVHGARFAPLVGLPRGVGGAISREGGGPPTITALEEIGLRLADGDRLGLIGHNGAGKSTLLRVIAGVYAPCAGQVRVSGRVLSLFDPFLGMTFDCTGRENVVLRGIFIGLTPAQARARIDEIAEFSELGAYMDLPLKAYSSGMQLRLAFSIATAFEPDILLLDEQFLLGDAAFIDKAERRLKSFVGRAGIVVQASHSEKLIRETCTRIVLLDRGRIVAAGEPEEMFALQRERQARRAAVAA